MGCSSSVPASNSSMQQSESTNKQRKQSLDQIQPNNNRIDKSGNENNSAPPLTTELPAPTPQNVKNPVTQPPDDKTNPVPKSALESPMSVKDTNGDDDTTVDKEDIASERPTEELEMKIAVPSEEESAQQIFDAAIRMACELVNPECIFKFANEKVYKLHLLQALPHTMSLVALLQKLPNLQMVDVSGNGLGPQGFRALLLGLCHNTSITTLNVANNQTDTDSAECIGKMLKTNKALVCLDVSGNYLGKDFFSRCVGPALAVNKSLQILRCESIGSTDLKAFMAGVQDNASLVELNLNHNELSNSQAFTQGLVTWLKKPTCCIKVLEMKNCGLKDQALTDLASGLHGNNFLQRLNVSGSQTDSLDSFCKFLVTCICDTRVLSLSADDVKMTNTSSCSQVSGTTPLGGSSMQSLSISGCSLSDSLFTNLAQSVPGALANLEELVLSNNPDLSNKALEDMHKVLQDENGTVRLLKLSLGLNSVEEFPAYLATGKLPGLSYLNLRKAKIGASSLKSLASHLKSGGINALVLDGIKLSGTDVLQNLLASGKDSSLSALSLGGCSLDDKDIQSINQALKEGLPLHMLKLSANRITAKGMDGFVQGLLAHGSHPLALIDLSNNRVDQNGAKELSKLFNHAKHKSNIHSLNLSNNCIEPAGVQAIVRAVGNSSLTAVQLNNQQVTYQETDMEAIFEELAKALELQVKMDESTVTPGGSKLNQPHAGLTVKLTGLGGETGDLGSKMNCVAIATDDRNKKLPSLSLEHILSLAATFKGLNPEECVMSKEEWNHVTGADKDHDIPSWLQISSHRANAVYVSNLPASVTDRKMEGILENEADCNVEEVYMIKDPVQRKNNGFAWSLLSDRESVDKAIQVVHNREAVVFGQPFLISRVNVQIDDEANAEAAVRAKRDLEHRLKDRRAEDAAHRVLIQESYQASQERHAYRLAHPAYADGRIW